MITVVAIVPAYNEVETIGAVVRGLAPFVRATLVVDDGSHDGTGAEAVSAGALLRRHETNRGKGHAVRTGLAWALAAPATHVLILDGDLQHVPQEASRLIEIAESTGADLVIGTRQFDREAMPISRYLANRIGSRALSSFVGVRLGDTQCGFRLYRADSLRRLPPLSSTGYEIETEMLVKVRRRQGTIAEAPVTAVYGVRSKLRPVRDTTRTCFLAVYYRFIEPLWLK
jgi:glycosyltransferase involved in cell wall biosynthesis